MVVFRAMLHNRQAQTRAARLLGAAAIHAVEALKHLILMLLGNADARIGHAHARAIRKAAYLHLHFAV